MRLCIKCQYKINCFHYSISKRPVWGGGVNPVPAEKQHSFVSLQRFVYLLYDCKHLHFKKCAEIQVVSRKIRQKKKSFDVESIKIACVSDGRG